MSTKVTLLLMVAVAIGTLLFGNIVLGGGLC